jgi:hypothetical protein
LLTGTYARRAAKSHKTKEGVELLTTVRAFIARMDVAMRQPSTFQRGQEVAHLITALGMAADLYDLFGEKKKKEKK